MSTIRYCPKCGKKLVLRKNSKTKETFWGCKGYPKCKFTHLKGVVDFVCEDYLKVDWYPNITYEASLILELCQSKVEMAYLLGAAYCIDDQDICKIDNQMLICKTTIQFESIEYPALVFYDPFRYWDGAVIPSAIAFVPQLCFAHKLHHDFGVFFSLERFGRGEKWHLHIAVEVDAHPAHWFDPGPDAFRDSLSPYKVLRLVPDTHDPLTWFKHVLFACEEANW